MGYREYINEFDDEILETLYTFLRDFTRWELPEDKQYLLDLCDEVILTEHLYSFGLSYPFLASAAIQEEYIQAEAQKLARHLLKYKRSSYDDSAL